jgi:hypothetical protein
LVEGLLVVVALPEKKKERLCERKVVLFGDYLDDTGEIENGASCWRFMKFYHELKGSGTHSHPKIHAYA